MSSAATYRDRDGTERDEAERVRTVPDHNPLCDGTGWLTTSTVDRRVPCFDCKPHLRRYFERRRLLCS